MLQNWVETNYINGIYSIVIVSCKLCLEKNSNCNVFKSKWKSDSLTHVLFTVSWIVKDYYSLVVREVGNALLFLWWLPSYTTASESFVRWSWDWRIWHCRWVHLITSEDRRKIALTSALSQTWGDAKGRTRKVCLAVGCQTWRMTNQN